MTNAEKEKLIKSDIARIGNRIRHAFNQGYDLGYKDGLQKSETVTEFADRCRECGVKHGKLSKQKPDPCDFCSIIYPDADTNDIVFRKGKYSDVDIDSFITIDKEGKYHVNIDSGDPYELGYLVDIKFCPYCGRKLAESKNKVDSGPTTSRFKCRAEQGRWCKRWERECVSWEHCDLSSYNFPCPGCVMSSPLEREECDDCCWKYEKRKHYESEENNE